MGGKSNAAPLIGSNSDRHITTHKHHDGVEAPRNSLDLPVETGNRHHANNDNLVVKKSSSKMNFHHQIGTPVKQLFNEDDSNMEIIKRGGPGVVARLMGMDPLPPEKVPTINVKECLDENQRKHTSRVPRFVSTKNDLSTFSTTVNISNEESPVNINKQFSEPSVKSPSTVKPHRREHPQEELLQKFKKEFVSWQASKSSECSNNLNQSENNRGLKHDTSSGALEDFNMEKIVRSANITRYISQKNPVEATMHTSEDIIRMAQPQVDGFHHEVNPTKQGVPRPKDEKNMTRKVAVDSYGPVSKGMIQEKRSRSCSPTRIVILKPSSDVNEIEEPRGGSSQSLEKNCSMEGFLEEVRERLRLEIEGKGRNVSSRKANLAHASLNDRPTDPKQLACDMAKRMRENVTREAGATLSVMSEFGNSFMNDFHLNEHETSSSIKGDARKIISERLKNALKDDFKIEKPSLNCERVGNSLFIKEKERTKSMSEYYSKEGKGASFWEDKKAVNESIPKYLRRECLKMTAYDADTMSPPNFIRSFSAPTSGTTSGKLILEDHQVVKGDQVCSKQEVSDFDSAVINRNKKDGFNFKGRVSNLRRNLSFKGKIFGKKISSNEESTSETFSYVQPIETIPLVIRNVGRLQDNYTEVPPSPASFSSTPSTENHSPVSPLEAPFVADQSSSQVSGELGMAPPDEKQPEHDRCKGPEQVELETQLHETSETLRSEGHAESYVRNILKLSGLYTSSPSDKSLSQLDPQTESISSSIFNELEDTLFKSGHADSDSCKLGDISIDRKLLFDLVNEALSIVFPPISTSMQKRWMQWPARIPQGRKLLEDVLKRIEMYSNSKVDQPEAELIPWFNTSEEDNGYIEMEVEGLIIQDLIAELVSDTF